MRFPSLDELLGLTWKDGWQSGSIYFEKDAVLFEGSVYVAIHDNQNVIPTDTGSWILFSKYLAVAGSLEDVGETLPLDIPSESPVLVTQPVAFTPPPPVSEWTWANQGTAVAYDDPAGIKFVIGPDDTEQICVFLLGDLPDAPYTITTAIPYPLFFVGNALRIILFDDVSGMFKDIQSTTVIYWDDYVNVNSFPNINNNVGSSGGLFSDALWVRVQDDGSNLIVSVSNEGLFFQVWAIVPRTDLVIPTKYGVGMKGQPVVAGYPQITQPYLLSFEITTP